jgi:exopolyphosphatase/guanosine-5'-triphosphate,3'-diphosphate pyrophosphatase
MMTERIKLRRGPGRRVGSGRARRDGNTSNGGGPQGKAYAALDLGTNNCRLLVATPEAGGFRVLDAFSRIVRLGEGLDREGRLTEAAIERTISALRVCATKMAKKRVLRARNVATEACRRAANCAQFLERVRTETGLEVEIISPREEAGLALAGCSPLMVDGFRYGLVFDIGGGSTEIMWVERLDADVSEPARNDVVRPPRLRLIDSVSIPLGVVSLAERHGGDRISDLDYEAMITLFRDPVGAFEARNEICEHIRRGEAQMLGTSGTVTTLAGIHLKLPVYDRKSVDGCFLDFDEIASVIRHLRSLDFAGRAMEPCIGEARADLVIAGCAILDAMCRAWPVGRLRVADRGVREGILFDLMGLGGSCAGVA